MLFNSFVFWGFFAIVLSVYGLLSHKYQNRMLLLASYVFYGYWDYRFLALIMASTVIDYFVANWIDDSRDKSVKRKILFISIVSNLGLLGFFKYYNFFSSELFTILDAMGIPIHLEALHIILPVGISFYTFQTMSYTIDVYRGVTKPSRNFADFALYVSFFPQLVAGPIERSNHLLPQILRPRNATTEQFIEGLYHILFGLFKKVVIADNMAPIVNHIFSKPMTELTGPEVLVGIYAFAFQIYGDFSGYSSIAQGIAKWLGFDLSWNFKMPYLSSSPSEFWQRWHISLSQWLRDYLYIPLGGNRGGLLRTQRNLMATMLLGGLWHGAAWTFIIWGFYHGLLLMIYRFLEYFGGKAGLRMPRNRLIKILNVIFFFHLICISWLLFRVESMDQFWGMLNIMATDFTMTDLAKYGFAMVLFFVTPFMLLELWIEKTGDLLRVVNSHWLFRTVVYLYFTIMIWVFPPLTNQAFIYFQF